MKISACFITKNEEKNIMSAIDSVRQIVDEIIVVDTGSADNTAAVAKRAGAVVYNYQWRDDFAAARNFALEQARYDWVIFLDADENLVIPSVTDFLCYLRNCPDDIDAFGCKIINIEKESRKEICSFPGVRIFRNQSDIRYVGVIHEHLASQSRSLKLAMLPTDIFIYHTGYSTDIVEAKLLRNLRLLQQDMQQNGAEPMHYRYLCDCYHGINQYEQSYKYGQIYLQSPEADEFGMKTNIYIKVLYALQQITKDSERIEREMLTAVKHYPKSPEFYMQYADFIFSKGRHDEALDYYLRAINILETASENVYTNNFKAYEYICYSKAASLLQKKESSLAATYYVKSLALNKFENLPSVAGLGQLLGDTNALVDMLNKIYDKSNRADMLFLLDKLLEMKLEYVYQYYSDEYLLSCLSKALVDDIDNVWRLFKEAVAITSCGAGRLFEILKMIHWRYLPCGKVDTVAKLGEHLPDRYCLKFWLEAYKQNYRNGIVLQKLIELLVKFDKADIAGEIISSCERQFMQDELYKRDSRSDSENIVNTIVFRVKGQLNNFQELFYKLRSCISLNDELIIWDSSCDEDIFAYMQLFRNTSRISYWRNRQLADDNKIDAILHELSSGSNMIYINETDLLGDIGIENFMRVSSI